MQIVCVIPARLNSTRLPRKVLTSLGGKPLLQWVYEAASRISLFDQVYFAVDAKETYDLVTSFGAPCFYTDVGCQNGTERIIELIQKKSIDGDLFVNWQADEPFIDEEMVSALLSGAIPEGDVWTLKKRIDRELDDPGSVKVVCNQAGEALYFSRSKIPYQGPCYKHLGIYAYTKKALLQIAQMNPCDLEEQEKLEQLRFLYYGLKVQVFEIKKDTIGIDTLHDLELAEKIIN